MQENPRILLALRRSLGDAVIFLGTINRVRQYFPKARITLLVPERYAEIYSGQPQVEETITYEGQGFLSLVAKLRASSFDYYFDFHSSGKNLWLVRLSGAKHAFFDVHSSDKGRLYQRYPNALEWNKFFLERILGPLQGRDPDHLFKPKIILSDQEKSVAAEKLRRNGMEPNRVIFLGLGASRRTKRWPPIHFARLAELIFDRYGMGVVLAPGPESVEQEFAAQVLGELRVKGLKPQPKGGIFLDGPLGIRALAALLSQCRMYIGNDSGPKHLAVASHIPTLTFFGPEDPGEWHPYFVEKHPYLFLEGLACRNQDGGRWCGLAECVTEKNRCMLDLDPFMALEKAKPFLEDKA